METDQGETELAGPPVAAGDPVVDDATLSQLRELIGPAQTRSLLDKLKVQIAQSFDDPADRKRLHQQAHSLASSSGMLGFLRLSRACLAIKSSSLGSDAIDEEFENALGNAMSAKDASLAAIHRTLRGPEGCPGWTSGVTVRAQDAEAIALSP